MSLLVPFQTTEFQNNWDEKSAKYIVYFCSDWHQTYGRARTHTLCALSALISQSNFLRYSRFRYSSQININASKECRKFIFGNTYNARKELEGNAMCPFLCMTMTLYLRAAELSLWKNIWSHKAAPFYLFGAVNTMKAWETKRVNRFPSIEID